MDKKENTQENLQDEEVEEEKVNRSDSLMISPFVKRGMELFNDLVSPSTKQANEFYQQPSEEQIDLVIRRIHILEIIEAIPFPQLMKLLEKLLELKFENLNSKLEPYKYKELISNFFKTPTEIGKKKIHVNWPISDFILALGRFLLKTKSPKGVPIITVDQFFLADFICSSFETYRGKNFSYRTVYDKLTLAKNSDIPIEKIRMN
jgi:hypothetical protein